MKTLINLFRSESKIEKRLAKLIANDKRKPLAFASIVFLTIN